MSDSEYSPALGKVGGPRANQSRDSGFQSDDVGAGSNGRLMAACGGSWYDVSAQDSLWGASDRIGADGRVSPDWPGHQPVTPPDGGPVEPSPTPTGYAGALRKRGVVD